MPTQFITLKDGIRIEAEVTDTRVAAKDGKIEQTIDSIKPTLVRVVQPVVAAWNELNQDMDIQQAEIELGFGFEASGNLFIASTKGNVNLKVKLVLKPSSAKQ